MIDGTDSDAAPRRLDGVPERPSVLRFSDFARVIVGPPPAPGRKELIALLRSAGSIPERKTNPHPCLAIGLETVRDHRGRQRQFRHVHLPRGLSELLEV